MTATSDGPNLLGNQGGPGAAVPVRFAHVDEDAVARGKDDELAVALFDIKNADFKRAWRPRGISGAHVGRAFGGGVALHAAPGAAIGEPVIGIFRRGRAVAGAV